MSTHAEELANCTGRCDKNPWGVCTHRQKCAHHARENEARAKAAADQAWVNEMTRAGSVNSHKMTQQNKRG